MKKKCHYCRTAPVSWVYAAGKAPRLACAKHAKKVSDIGYVAPIVSTTPKGHRLAEGKPVGAPAAPEAPTRVPAVPPPMPPADTVDTVTEQLGLF